MTTVIESTTGISQVSQIPAKNAGIDGESFKSLIQAAAARQTLNQQDSDQREIKNQKHQEWYGQTTPLREEMGEAFAQIRQLFTDMGMPIADMVMLNRTPVGTFKVSGWGLGEPVNHPQGQIIEDILNGKIPKLSGMTEQIARIVEKLEDLHTKIQDIDEKYAPALGRDFTRQDSFFDDSVGFATEYTSNNQGEARKLIAGNEEAFNAFKTSLGSDLD